MLGLIPLKSSYGVLFSISLILLEDESKMKHSGKAKIGARTVHIKARLLPGFEALCFVKIGARRSKLGARFVAGAEK